MACPTRRVSQSSPLVVARFSRAPFPKVYAGAYGVQSPTNHGERSMQWKRDAKPSTLQNISVIGKKNIAPTAVGGGCNCIRQAKTTKTYHIIDKDEPILEKAIGTEIKWHAGNCFTENTLKKNSKKGSKNTKPMIKIETCESFFNFFNPPQVKDSGSGIIPQDVPNLFTKFANLLTGKQPQPMISVKNLDLPFATENRFINLMEGNLRIESDGLCKGRTAIFIIKLGSSVR